MELAPRGEGVTSCRVYLSPPYYENRLHLLSVGYLFVIAGVFVIVALATQLFTLIAPYVDPSFNYIQVAPYFFIPGGVLMIILGLYEKRKPTGSMWRMKHERKNADS